jgi:hypothetical protein
MVKEGYPRAKIMIISTRLKRKGYNEWYAAVIKLVPFGKYNDRYKCILVSSWWPLVWSWYPLIEKKLNSEISSGNQVVKKW